MFLFTDLTADAYHLQETSSRQTELAMSDFLWLRWKSTSSIIRFFQVAWIAFVMIRSKSWSFDVLFGGKK